MSYAPDPGGIFASDVHRRVAGHLPICTDDPTGPAALLARIDGDGSTPIFNNPEGADALAAVLDSLISDGLAEKVGEDYRMTPAGFEKLTGPIAKEPGPLEGARLKAGEALDAELAKEDAEAVAQSKKDRVERAKAELAEAQAALTGGKS